MPGIALVVLALLVFAAPADAAGPGSFSKQERPYVERFQCTTYLITVDARTWTEEVCELVEVCYGTRKRHVCGPRYRHGPAKRTSTGGRTRRRAAA